MFCSQRNSKSGVFIYERILKESNDSQSVSFYGCRRADVLFGDIAAEFPVFGPARSLPTAPSSMGGTGGMGQLPHQFGHWGLFPSSLWEYHPLLPALPVGKGPLAGGPGGEGDRGEHAKGGDEDGESKGRGELYRLVCEWPPGSPVAERQPWEMQGWN